MNEFVEGLAGVNKAYAGKNLNHIHICELKSLGLIYGSEEKKIESFCPCGIKYKFMNNDDACDDCIHSRRINLSDDGNHITDVK